MCAGNAEGIKNQIYQSISGNHDEHAENSPEDFPFPLFPTGIRSLGRNKLKYTPEKYQESNCKSQ